jgi:hypothetical protein
MRHSQMDSDVIYEIQTMQSKRISQRTVGLIQRCTSRAQRTVCDDVCCCAVHACSRWNGMYMVRGVPHRQLEGKANGLWVRETDDPPATVWWGVQVRHSQFAHLHSALHVCRNLVHIWFNRTTPCLFLQWPQYRPLLWGTYWTACSTGNALVSYPRDCRFDPSVDTSYPDPDISWFSPYFHSSIGIVSRLATTASFLVLFNSSFIYYRSFRRYILIYWEHHKIIHIICTLL